MSWFEPTQYYSVTQFNPDSNGGLSTPFLGFQKRKLEVFKLLLPVLYLVEAGDPMGDFDRAFLGIVLLVKKGLFSLGKRNSVLGLRDYAFGGNVVDLHLQGLSIEDFVCAMLPGILEGGMI